MIRLVQFAWFALVFFGGAAICVYLPSLLIHWRHRLGVWRRARRVGTVSRVPEDTA